MILLKKLRLINWYGFSNETAPIGFFTLIAGKNGNGKSVMMDAIKYSVYGDTVFNKSSESKGSRTLSSYTRGLLDATAGTYMRPPEQIPYVYSHIALEFSDDVEDKSFVLGTVIETSPSNNCQVYRYAMDQISLDQVEHTYTDQGVPMPCSASQFQKKYRVTLMNREQGLPKFLQMTGLKLSLSQLSTYLRKLRGIMSYDPNARIDQFIRESVLEQRNVDFGKLIEAKENIERLNEGFNRVQQEIEELDGIIEEYDIWEAERNRLLADDIRIVYKKLQDMGQEIERQKREQNLALGRIEDLKQELELLDGRKRELDGRLVQAKVSLEQLDSTRMILEERKRLDLLEEEKKELTDKCRRLEQFQTVVSEMMAQLFKWDGSRECVVVKHREVLASLCQHSVTAAEKAAAVTEFRRITSVFYDELVGELAGSDRELEELNRSLDAQHRIVEECKKHRNTYGQIPDYVSLRDEINREFDKRKIDSRARFACDYVIGLKDEAWRDALEAFLGPRRYTILVDPQYYDIADDVLNVSEHRYAHLFNTKLLMKRKVQVEENSAVYMLEISNSLAKKYFEFQLGRIHAVELGKVREYENAISKEGRVSVSMDSYFLRLDRIHSYYLGQKTFELNKVRAEKEIFSLNEEKKKILARRKQLMEEKSRLELNREFFREYDYDAHKKYQEAAAQARQSKAQLERLEKSQRNNLEFLELTELVGRLTDEQNAAQAAYGVKLQEKSIQDTVVQRCAYRIDTKMEELEIQQKRFREFQIESYSLVQRTVEAYEKYLQNGKKGAGGLLADETRSRINRSIGQHRDMLTQKQAEYNVKHSNNILPTGTEGRDRYADRRERIWMDDLQEIRQKLEEQTRRYEEVFKNEFVLTILKSCERAKEELKQINGELNKLNFSAKYQFDVHFVKDGSEYAKVIEYARFLDEREQLGGGADGQITFDLLTSVSNEEGEELEKEMQRIINRIIEKNSEETIARFADYRNYMTYEILISNQVLDHAKLSRQTGYNSGAEVQIPYLLILSSALLMIYNQRVNSTRLVFIDEPFAKMDPGNVKLMLDFMRRQGLQVIFCSPDKTESIGHECEVILPVLKTGTDSRMQLGIVQFYEGNAYERL